MEDTDSSREKTQKRNATKIQSSFRGYNTRKLTTAIKNNSRSFLQGPSNQEKRARLRSRMVDILNRVFNKTHEATYGTSRDSSDEAKLIMSYIKKIGIKKPAVTSYVAKIQSLVTKMKDTLSGFHGTIEEARAKVYKDLEELRYLFHIPFYKAWGWHFRDQEGKTTRSVQNPLPPDWFRNSEGQALSLSESVRADSKFLYDWFLDDPAVLMERYIQKELPILFPYNQRIGYSDLGVQYMKSPGFNTRKFTQRERRKTNATKIQSIFRGYDTRKLTNAIKKNYTRFKKGPTRQERRGEVPVILNQKFNKTHEATYGTSRDSKNEVDLIMSRLKQTQEEDFVEYVNKIQSLVKKIKDKLDGFNGTKEEARAKVYKDLEELRYLFHIPFNKAWGWHFRDQELKTVNSVRNPMPHNWSEDPMNYFHLTFGPDMDNYIIRELPILFRNERIGRTTNYMNRRGGRRKNTHTIKLRKKYIKIY